ncbi:MAG: DeoR/GlpR transcriptional regulator [candidate division NC10 bacterium]|nr:DeoR/GlpR transcriptional regulator [candidate division NC10 bacterium]MBI2114931.1 DeoR/GlpR transcriptional regulator [candidate division NC10 bacterium]MBI2163845.1 DeoR/GlpR transcriptional regulator [candidate division NC10 bacterium]MBI2454623.1 DeoR/GlpR transcriptional regulator [candidate division NC10 bacterium]MBI3085765.1 DeoR/GlpR transcriptional regulator [candidate division NC10 bacterium]
MARMIAAQRRARIVDLVNRRGILSVAELARVAGASLMSIRRDLTLLDAQGLLRRAHGGAVALAAPPDVPLQRRERLELQAKMAIGRAAAALVHPGETILLDAGTTVRAMTHSLRGVQNLTVVTNSVQVLAVLWDRPGLRVVALGGVARSGSGAITGPLAEKTLEELRVDRAFLGATGITPRWEVSNSDLDLAALERRILAAARESHLLADHTKFGRTGLAIVSSLRAFTSVITDAHVPPNILTQLRKHVRKVLVAR